MLVLLLAAPLPAFGAPPSGEDQTEAGPTMTIDVFNDNKQERLRNLLSSSGDRKRRLIQVLPDDDPAKIDLSVRFGELLAEKRAYYVDQVHALHQKILDAAPARRAPLMAQRAAAAAEAEKWFLEATKAYRWATRAPGFAGYERADQVLLKFGDLLAAGKKPDQARELYLRLINEHPSSQRVADAYVAMAELAFDQGDMDAALELYEKVDRFPTARIYPFALYKKGWCYLRSGQHDAALAMFVSVVRATENPASRAAGERPVSADRGRYAGLAREAKKDIVKVYSRVGVLGEAPAFFRTVGGDYAPKMVRDLAERYRRQGRVGEAALLEAPCGGDEGAPRD